MTRVPTYATYMNMLNQTMKNKAQFELYNYQSITGLKAQTYSGYGMSAEYCYEIKRKVLALGSSRRTLQ